MKPNIMKEDINKNLQFVYTEASSWVRSANDVAAKLTSIFIPVSISILWFAIDNPKLKIELGLGSLFFFIFWVILYLIYGNSATRARKQLIEIEKEWDIPIEVSFYQKEKLVGNRKLGLRNFLFFISAVYLALWIIIIF